jgi:two-component system CheB/CheR fusion protein
VHDVSTIVLEVVMSLAPRAADLEDASSMIDSTDHQSELERLLGDLVAGDGVDFTRYDRRSLGRRVQQRMAALGVDALPSYRARLQADEAERARLAEDLLVHVTTFFRDPHAWAFLAGSVVPRIVAAARERSTIRMWSAGCASGEEAISLAILLAEAMGVDGLSRRVKIYATDRDASTLARARRARFEVASLAAMPERLAAKYFSIDRGVATLVPLLRECITFGRLDLVKDVPISHLDLVACRNTLMYFDPRTQAEVLTRFAFALDPGGVLFLGRAELPPLSWPRPFDPLSLEHHIFTKTRGA